VELIPVLNSAARAATGTAAVFGPRPKNYLKGTTIFLTGERRRGGARDRPMVSRTAQNGEAGGPEPRVSSGNGNLDIMLYGGFVARRPYLLVGPGGTGKSKLALGFLCEGVRRGEKVLLVTLEEPPNEIRSNHRGLSPLLDQVYVFDAIPDVMRYERAPFKDIAAVRHAVPFSEVPYEIRKTPELTSVEVTFTALEQTLKMEITRRNYTRLVIDSLTALQYFCMKGVDEVGGAQTFLRFLSDLRVTTVLTVESPIEESETAERLLARGEVRLSRWEVDDRTIQAIGVEKFRGSAHDIRRHPYRIGPVGLDIDLETTVSRDPAGTGSARSEQAKERARNRPASSLPDVVALIAAVRDLVEVGVDVSSAQAEVDRAAAATESGRTAAAGRHLLRARGIVSQLALEWERTRESPQPPAPPAAFRSAEPKLEAPATTAAIPPPAPKLPAWLQETTAVPAEPAPAPAPSARGPAVAPPPAPTKPRSFSLPPVTLRRTASRPPLPSAPAAPPGLVALPRGASSPESPLAGTAAGPAPLSVGLLLVTPSVTPHEAGAPDGMTAGAPVAPPATRIENPTPAAPSPVGGLGTTGPIESGRAARRARRRGTSRKAFAGAAGGFAAAPVTPTPVGVPGGDGAVRDGPIPESPVRSDVAALVPVPVEPVPPSNGPRPTPTSDAPDVPNAGGAGPAEDGTATSDAIPIVVPPVPEVSEGAPAPTPVPKGPSVASPAPTDTQPAADAPAEGSG